MAKKVAARAVPLLATRRVRQLATHWECDLADLAEFVAHGKLPCGLLLDRCICSLPGPGLEHAALMALTEVDARTVQEMREAGPRLILDGFYPLAVDSAVELLQRRTVRDVVVIL